MSDVIKENEVDPIELNDPDILTIFEIIKNGVKKLKDKSSVILWSSFILLLVWGPRGYTELIPMKWFYAFIPDFGWRDELISFVLGFILLFIIPCCIIKFYFKEKLTDYGLGWTNSRVKLGLLALFVTFAICAPIFYMGTSDPAMAAEYPLFRDHITTWGGFIVYQLVYFLFFINIEFIFRGYLLFGLFGPVKEDKKKEDAPKLKKPKEGPYFGIYAVLFQMLPYTMWHLSKPMPEYMGTIIWGVAVALIALKIRSIWPIIIVHWMLNIVVDLSLWTVMP
jgi:membrane protease YdiL (CAAX protease family)